MKLLKAIKLLYMYMLLKRIVKKALGNISDF